MDEMMMKSEENRQEYLLRIKEIVINKHYFKRLK